MELSNYTFPFGQPIQNVEQIERMSKRVFVLGVYASAVHARWLDNRGNELVKALAVASEPNIFWRGEDASAIISSIDMPQGAGRLESAESRFNGPSGRSLDEHFLHPLGLKRDDVWLCDCVPYSCMNSGQRSALERVYYSAADKYGLSPVNWPSRPTKIAKERVEEIADELRDSQAEIAITLGNDALSWFASKKLGSKQTLRSYGTQQQTYGQLHSVQFAERTIMLLPLTHPRQAARIAPYTPHWADLHEIWRGGTAPKLIS